MVVTVMYQLFIIITIITIITILEAQLPTHLHQETLPTLVLQIAVVTTLILPCQLVGQGLVPAKA
jgi:hypothetical protein